MTVKELMKKLKEVDENNTVTIGGYSFSGVSFDDNNDVELYIAGGDQPY